jgi:serine protease Do
MRYKLFIVTIFISLFGIVTYDSYATALPDNAIATLKQSGKAFANVAKVVSPAVVSIQSEVASPHAGEPHLDELGALQPFFEDLFKHFGQPAPQQGNNNNQKLIFSQGSGFIITKDGYIVTNNHLVENTTKITVILQDEKEYPAKLIGTDPLTDIAVIKIEGKNFPVLPMGDSDKIEVGEWVIAIGSPMGLSHSISAGIVSAKGRSKVGILDYENFIQTDAAINSGNSGGPLVDLDAKAIGINTAIVSKSGGSMGIGFAIPSNMASGIVKQLMKTGTVTRGYLGVKVQDLTSSLAKSFKMSDRQGVLVSMVMPNSPAHAGGLKQGDVVLEVDGNIIKGASEFRNLVAFGEPNSAHKVKILRNGMIKNLNVVIGVLSNSADNTKAIPEQKTLDKLGISVTPLDSELALQLGVQATSGVVITNVASGSIAELAGLRRGSVIVQINGHDVQDIRNFESALKDAGNQNIRMLVEDQRGPRFVAVSFN